MKKGCVVPVNEENFRPYGSYYHVTQGESCSGDWYRMFTTKDVVVERPLKFGITQCDNGKTFLVDSMERHLSSEEVQFAGSAPIILSVADSDPWGNPREEDVASFLLSPGDVVVLKRGIWHDACHSAERKTMYFFLSYTNGEPSETAWLPVLPEPVKIELE